MSEIIVQDMRWPHSTPQIAADRVARQSDWSHAFPGWVWGCVETYIPGTRGRGQSVEEICQQRLAKDCSRE